MTGLLLMFGSARVRLIDNTYGDWGLSREEKQ